MERVGCRESHTDILMVVNLGARSFEKMCQSGEGKGCLWRMQATGRSWTYRILFVYRMVLLSMHSDVGVPAVRSRQGHDGADTGVCQYKKLSCCLGTHPVPQ